MVKTDNKNRPDEAWKYPYVAGAFDFGSNFTVRTKHREDSRFGIIISPQILFDSTDAAVLGFIDEFCMNHGIEPRLREQEANYRLSITARDYVRDFLQLIRPYVLSRSPEVEILLDDLIPALENRAQSTEEGMLEVMGYVDEIRKHTVQRREPKYTQDYFREQFNL